MVKDEICGYLDNKLDHIKVVYSDATSFSVECIITFLTHMKKASSISVFFPFDALKSGSSKQPHVVLQSSDWINDECG